MPTTSSLRSSSTTAVMHLISSWIVNKQVPVILHVSRIKILVLEMVDQTLGYRHPCRFCLTDNASALDSNINIHFVRNIACQYQWLAYPQPKILASPVLQRNGIHPYLASTISYKSSSYCYLPFPCHNS